MPSLTLFHLSSPLIHVLIPGALHWALPRAPGALGKEGRPLAAWPGRWLPRDCRLLAVRNVLDQVPGGEPQPVGDIGDSFLRSGPGLSYPSA